MRTRTIDELRDLAPAYVMDTLAPNERAEFEAALASSPELAADVAEQRAVAETLATEWTVAPPPGLRGRFLERIAAERPTVRKPAARSAAGSRRWIPTVLVTALAASLVFTVARERNATITRDALRASLQQRDSALADATARLHQRDTQFSTILGAERQLVLVYLLGSDTRPDAYDAPGMQLFWNTKSGKGALHAFRLPPARNGHMYELWLIKDGRAVPVYKFNSNAEGHGVSAGFALPRDLSGVRSIIVTEEPASGSMRPSTAPVLTGSITRL